jgi:hypothetical protein
VAQADHNARIWDVVHSKSDVPTVLDLEPSLEMPTLIIWCQEDRIFHISGAALLDQNLPSSHLATLDNCGHVPMLDKPTAVASEYLKFLSSLPDPEYVRRQSFWGQWLPKLRESLAHLIGLSDGWDSFVSLN